MVLNHPPKEQSTRTPSATPAAYCHPFQSRAASRWAGKRGRTVTRHRDRSCNSAGQLGCQVESRLLSWHWVSILRLLSGPTPGLCLVASSAFPTMPLGFRRVIVLA